MAVIFLSLTTMAYADDRFNGNESIGQDDLKEIELNQIDLNDKQLIITGIEQLDEINQNSKFKVKTLNVNGETIKALVYTKASETKDIGLIVLNTALQIGFIALFIFLIIGKLFRYDVGRYVEGLVYIGFVYFIWITFF